MGDDRIRKWSKDPAYTKLMEIRDGKRRVVLLSARYPSHRFRHWSFAKPEHALYRIMEAASILGISYARMKGMVRNGEVKARVATYRNSSEKYILIPSTEVEATFTRLYPEYDARIPLKPCRSPRKNHPPPDGSEGAS